MFEWLLLVLRQLFPLAPRITAHRFVENRLADNTLQANVASLEVAAQATRDRDRLRELRDLANSKIKDEDSRQASIISRAQALFVALAILGTLFTFAASFLTTTAAISKPWLGSLGVIVGYILVQLILMVHNIISAIAGTGYPTSGSSDMTRWMRLHSIEDFYRAQALLTLSHYRTAALNNTWRFEYLEQALRGLRNVVYALGIVIACLFAVGFADGVAPAAISDRFWLAR